MAGHRVPFAAAACVLLAGALSHAQTNDLYFRGWAWTAVAGASLSMWMATASVALRDDLSALEGNPAGLASLERNELAVSLAERGAGHTSASDSGLARASLGHVAVAARFGARWAIGAYASRPQATRIEMATASVVEALGTAGRETGRLDSITTDAGAALALRLGDHLLLGGRLTLSRLSLEGEYSLADVRGETWRMEGAGGRASAVLGSGGAQLVLSRKVRLGVSYAQGGTWELERRDVSPVLGLNLDQGTSFMIQRPSVAALGLAWQPTYGAVFLLQAERLGYGPLGTVPPLPPGSLPYPTSAWRERIGAEHSWALSRLAFQLRLGLVLSAPTSGSVASSTDEQNAMDVRSDAYEALGEASGHWADGYLQTLEDPRDEPTAFTAGASIVMATGPRLDLAVRASSQRIVTSLGLALRF